MAEPKAKKQRLQLIRVDSSWLSRSLPDVCRPVFTEHTIDENVAKIAGMPHTLQRSWPSRRATADDTQIRRIMINLG
jgi:hypothetical protein